MKHHHTAGRLYEDSRWDATAILTQHPTPPAPMFAPDGTVWIVHPNVLRHHHDWYGPDTRGVLSDPLEAIDVDAESDLTVAEALVG